MIGKPGAFLRWHALATLSTNRSQAQTPIMSALRGATPLNEEGPAAPSAPTRNTAERETRNYPEQPPVIPHRIND